MLSLTLLIAFTSGSRLSPDKAAFPHWLRVFDGSHEWATPAVIDEALAWFRVRAMKRNLEPRNEEFIAAQLASARERAEFFEKSGARSSRGARTVRSTPRSIRSPTAASPA